MDSFLLILGILLTFWAIIEGLWTTLWVDGNSAPFTARFTSYTWRFLRKISGNKNHKFLSLSGPIILTLTVVTWITFILIGWTIIFYAAPDALVPKDKTPVDFTDAFWFAGYTMFTVGNGDFSPQTDFWQVISSIVAISGMLMVTLSVTYILQIVSAVVNKRSFANTVIGIGQTPEEFVIKQWTGDGFGAFELQLNSLNQQLSQLTDQHLAYPILNYYHAEKYENSMGVAVAVFDEALSIVEKGVQEKYHPALTILSTGRKTVSSFIDSLQSAFIHPSKDVPDAPDYQKLKEQNIPMISESAFKTEIEKISSRRKSLAGMVENDAWHWPGNSR